MSLQIELDQLRRNQGQKVLMGAPNARPNQVLPPQPNISDRMSDDCLELSDLETKNHENHLEQVQNDFSLDQIDVKLFDSKRSSIVDHLKQAQSTSCVYVEDAINNFMDTVYSQALKQIIGPQDFQPPLTPPTKKYINNKSRPGSIDILNPQQCYSPTFADDDETGRYNYQNLAIQQGFRNSPMKTA